MRRKTKTTPAYFRSVSAPGIPHRHRALAFERGLFTKQIHAERNIGAGLLTRDIAQARDQAIEGAGELFDGRRSLHHLLCTDRIDKRLDASHGDAQLAFQPAV